MQTFILISLSGLCGVWFRYFLSISTEGAMEHFWSTTLVVNIVGSFLAGAIFSLSADKGLISSVTATVLLVGFCGGFTTFSAYSLHNFQLLHSGAYAQAAVYMIGSPLLGLVATFFGVYVVRGLIA